MTHMRILSSVQHKGRVFGGRLYSIIVCELCHGQPIDPVRLLMVYKEPKVLLDLLIDPFCLAVCLRMEGSRCGHLDSQELIDFSHNFGGELGSLIRKNLLRQSVEFPNIISEQSSYSFCRD